VLPSSTNSHNYSKNSIRSVVPCGIKVKIDVVGLCPELQNILNNFFWNIPTIIVVDESAMICLKCFPAITDRIQELAPDIYENDLPIAFRRKVKPPQTKLDDLWNGRLIEVLHDSHYNIDQEDFKQKIINTLKIFS